MKPAVKRCLRVLLCQIVFSAALKMRQIRYGALFFFSLWRGTGSRRRTAGGRSGNSRAFGGKGRTAFCRDRAFWTDREGRSIEPNQPGNALRFVDKPEKGKDLFDLTNRLHYTDNPDGLTDWILCRAEDEPDMLWAFEFYRNDDSFLRHFTDAKVDRGHEDVITNERSANAAEGLCANFGLINQTNPGIRSSHRRKMASASFLILICKSMLHGHQLKTAD